MIIGRETTAASLKKMGAKQVVDYLTPPSKWSFIDITDADAIFLFLSAIASMIAIMMGVASGSIYGYLVGMLMFIGGLAYMLYMIWPPTGWYTRFVNKYAEYDICWDEGRIIDNSGEDIAIEWFVTLIKAVTRKA
jgi:hypothetical protein